MSQPVITILPDESLHDALGLMRTKSIRRLPVVNKRGRLVGIVSEGDLLHASPSDASSLSIWEMNHLLSKLTVDELMTKDVIAVPEDTPLEEAARIMADNKIGGLPIVRDGAAVGIITETDLFKVFLEMLGARESGVRAAVIVPNVPGELAKLTGGVFEVGGNILALGTFLGERTDNREVVLKVNGVEKETLLKSVQPIVERVVDIRDSPAA
ncbi:MAG: CBS domain-containing protein [Anaerolineales bacterium]|nr:CBS domain-containing protein [Anaerolineales bacterium]